MIISIYLGHMSSFKLVRFGGAGIFFWYQAGAAKYLQQHYDLKETAFLGASAGAITAAMMISNASFDRGAEIAIQQTVDGDLYSKKSGLAGVWGPMVRSFLEELIDDSKLTKDDYERIHIAVTPRLILRGTKILTDFPDKASMIDAVMSSVHIPLFMDGRLWSQYQGRKYLDGSLWSFLLPGNKGPLPKSLQPLSWETDILDIDYKQDRRFMENTDTGNIVKLITPEGLYDMMNYGYEYMSTQRKLGKLPASR
jgi:hypothetical protein